MSTLLANEFIPRGQVGEWFLPALEITKWCGFIDTVSLAIMATLLLISLPLMGKDIKSTLKKKTHLTMFQRRRITYSYSAMFVAMSVKSFGDYIAFSTPLYNTFAIVEMVASACTVWCCLITLCYRNKILIGLFN